MDYSIKRKQAYLLVMTVLNMQEETMQFLYSEGNTIHLLNPETFDQIEMPMNTCETGEDGAAMLEGIPWITVIWMIC